MTRMIKRAVALRQDHCRVIPAKAGIHFDVGFQPARERVPAFAGTTVE